MWLDGGQIRQFGSTAEVISTYEAALTSGGVGNTQRLGGSRPKANFKGWEIVDPRADQPHILNSLDPVTVKFVLQVNEPVQSGRHGIALFNIEEQLMWAWEAKNVQLTPGLREFCYSFPTLPLRPGVYSWRVSLYDENGLLDHWSCLPEMIIATEVHQHPLDQWNGVLNVPCRFVIKGENRYANAVHL